MFDWINIDWITGLFSWLPAEVYTILGIILVAVLALVVWRAIIGG